MNASMRHGYTTQVFVRQQLQRHRIPQYHRVHEERVDSDAGTSHAIYTHTQSLTLSLSPIKTAITHPFPHTTRHSLCNTHTHTHTYTYIHIYICTYPLSPRMMIFKSVLFLAADMTAHFLAALRASSLCFLSLRSGRRIQNPARERMTYSKSNKRENDLLKIQQERE